MNRPCAFLKAVFTVLVALTVMFVWPFAVMLGGIGLAIWVLYAAFRMEDDAESQKSGKD